ncbi:hypothetical protein PSACC_00282 [Paramicrosporidium saccamoebae]|uniref:Cell division control protein 73 C-terminal domain-containing protein n=1 Tax=Paramicrosporidium saccamoebae TaxID=1246581 RepID=A0A2H9TQ57_9FUNG|nr:hypothetical protein PSACC_00282 [Paramicrosporidium saccamoebae]
MQPSITTTSATLESQMDPLLTLRKCLKTEGSVTLHDHSGTQVGELPQCVYLKLGGYIFPRDAPTNFRSKRGAGDFYPLDAVWFMLERREGSYSEYMQEARRNGVGVVSLVDRKDLVAYLEEEQRPEDCQFVDLTAPLPAPRRSFGDDEAGEEVWEEPVTAVLTTAQTVSTSRVKSRPAKARDSGLLSVHKDFSNVLEIAIEMQKSLTEAAAVPLTNARQPVSLIDQITSANRPAQKPVQVPVSSREALIPIIVVPATPTALLTMYNVRQFLEGGHFVSQADAKAEGRPKENSLFFEHKIGGRKIRIQVVDNPTRLSSADWDRVAAVFVQGNTWQFKGWKWDTPVDLFQHVKGFVLDFDEKGQDPKISGWNVTRLTINRSRRHLDSNVIFQFWSKFEDHLKSRRML